MIGDWGGSAQSVLRAASSCEGAIIPLGGLGKVCLGLARDALKYACIEATSAVLCGGEGVIDVFPFELPQLVARARVTAIKGKSLVIMKCIVLT